MAEFEFGNPMFDDDYDEGGVEDAEDETAEDKEDREDFVRRNKNTQRMIEQQMESVKHKSGDTLEDARKKLIREKVDNFVLFNKEKGGTPAIVNYSDFKIKDGLLHVQAFSSSKEIPLEYKKGDEVHPYRLSYLERKYGAAFVRNTLGFQDYAHPKSAPRVASCAQQAAQQAQHQAAKQTLQELSTEEQHIQPKDVSDTVELQELTNIGAKADKIV